MSDAPLELTLGELLERHHAILLDAYGVLVDGTRALPGAAALIERLEREARPWLVVTNDASRSPRTSAARYRALGVPVPDDKVQTSGQLLARAGLEGGSFLVLGPDDSFEYVRQAGATALAPEVFAPEHTDGIVIGDEGGHDFVAAMDGVLSLAFARLDAGRPLRLLLPNPDLVYPKSAGRFGFAAGSMAGMLEAALHLRYGSEAPRFERLGKPHRPIFDAALDRLGVGEALMMGDQLATDIAGARRAGLHAALVGDGVGGVLPEDPELRPHYRIGSLLG